MSGDGRVYMVVESAPRRCDGELRCLLFQTIVGVCCDVFACCNCVLVRSRRNILGGLWRGLYHRVV